MSQNLPRLNDSLGLPGLVVAFDVLGCAAPKGSARAMKSKYTGQAMLVPSGSPKNKERLRQWDANVRAAASEAIGERESPPFVGVALECEITFFLARPAGHWGVKGLKPSAPLYPIPKPDVGKLARSTEDSLTGIVFDDDSRIVNLIVRKRYALPGKEGAIISVREVVG